MELLHMGQELGPMTLPLLPVVGGHGGAATKPAPLKANSLSRLEELQQYLRHCDEHNYNRYVKGFSSMRRDLLDDLTHQIKARSAWLCAEEQREYKRAKLLNVMGATCCPPSSDDGAGGDASWPATAADAFCSQVLEGSSCSGGSGYYAAVAAGDEAAVAVAFVAGTMPLERLEMVHEQQPFMTPADAPKSKTRVQPPALTGGPQAGGGAGDAEAGGVAGTPNSDASPPDTAVDGDGVVADHQISGISPDGQPTLAAAAPQQATTSKGSGSSRVRQTALLPDK